MPFKKSSWILPAFLAGLTPIAAAQTAPTGPNDKREYFVATAHLDTNWLWTIQDTIRDHLPKTLRVNFRYFEKYPDYVFNFEGAFRYMLIKEYYPDDYAKLKDYVAKGRWRVAGSWVDAVDSNMPSPESLIRHALYGNGFFEKEFGKTSEDVFLPDCFGFGYALPSIARFTGLRGFSTQKLSWGSSIGTPFPVGQWQGVDGSRIIAALDPGGYGSTVPADAASNPGLLARVDKTGQQSGAYVDYRYHGTGDTGGGPQDVSVFNLENEMHAGGPLKIVSASTDQLFRDLTPDQVSKLPLYNGELLLMTHGTGCYTSQAAMKKWNRENELLADKAERAAVAANWLGGMPYPKEKLSAAWVRMLWHQFHDDLTGTSIPTVYPFSWNDEGISLNQFADVLSSSVGTIAEALDTQVKGVPVVVNNPLSIEREDVVTASVKFPVDMTVMPNVRVFDPRGREVPSQVVGSEGNSVTVKFLAKSPSVGTAVYSVVPSTSACNLNTGLHVTDSSLESNRYKVTIDGNGDVSSIWDKSVGKELLKSPMRMEMRTDLSVDWPSWEIKWNTEQGAPREYVQGPAKVTVVENGPARVALQVEREAAGSKFVQTISLSAGEGARVEFDSKIDWKTKGTLLKQVFNLTSENPTATYDLGLGTIDRPNDTDKKYEVVAQQWADLTAPNKSYGATVMSDSKYGWDKPSDDTLRLTLIHTAKAGRGYKFQETNDLGHHHIVFAIEGHKGDWRNGSMWQAARLNQPETVYQTEAHRGWLGKQFSMVRSSTPQVAVESLKQAENSDEVVVHLFEKYGQKANARISFPANIVSVREVNGVEKPVSGGLAFGSSGSTLSVSMDPYKPRAFAVKLASSAKTLSAPSSVAVSLPYDTNVVTGRNETAGDGFDGQGHAYAAELWPSQIHAEGVAFKMGPAASKNAIACNGQTISLPAGDGNRVYILASASSDDTEGTFTVGGKQVPVKVENFTGKINQWDNRVVNGKVVDDPTQFDPAFMKRDSVAWVGTHRHDKDGKDDLYIDTYLFKYAIDLPKGATSITLPNNSSIKVMAISVANDGSATTAPAMKLYD